MLSCRPIIEKVTDYLEDRLGPLARLGFAIHIKTCWQCRQYLEQVKAVIESVARLPAPEDAPAPEVVARLREAFSARDSFG